MTPVGITVLVVIGVLVFASSIACGYAAMDGDLDGRSAYRGDPTRNDHYNNCRKWIYDVAKARAMHKAALNEQRAREREKS